jgi:hypothetical protein
MMKFAPRSGRHAILIKGWIGTPGAHNFPWTLKWNMTDISESWMSMGIGGNGRRADGTAVGQTARVVLFGSHGFDLGIRAYTTAQCHRPAYEFAVSPPPRQARHAVLRVPY